MTLQNKPTELISNQDSSHLLFVSLQSVFIDIARGDWIFWSINQLNVEIPSSIGNLTNLGTLDLSDNQLTGEIPIEICNQGDSTPRVGNNQLCGPYPSCISQGDINSQDTSNCP